MASAAKSKFESSKAMSETSVISNRSAREGHEEAQRSKEERGINTSSNSQNCNSAVPGSDQQDRKFSRNLVKRSTASTKTPESDSRSEQTRGSGRRFAGATATHKEQQVCVHALLSVVD